MSLEAAQQQSSARVAALDIWFGRVDPMPLAGGITNQNFKVEDRGKRYVVPRDDVIILEVDNIVVEALAAIFAQQLVERLGADLRPEVVASLEVTISESSNQGGTARVRL